MQLAVKTWQHVSATLVMLRKHLAKASANYVWLASSKPRQGLLRAPCVLPTSSRIQGRYNVDATQDTLAIQRQAAKRARLAHRKIALGLLRVCHVKSIDLHRWVAGKSWIVRATMDTWGSTPGRVHRATYAPSTPTGPMQPCAHHADAMLFTQGKTCMDHA